MSALVVLLMICSPVVLFGRDLYVTPNGSDTAPGTKLSPCSLSKAANTAVPGDICHIAPGTYRETLKPRHDGLPGKPITFLANRGETVVFSGCDPVTGWEPHKDGMFRASMNWSLGKNNLLFANGKPLQEARWPNDKDGDPMTVDAANVTRGDALKTSIVCDELPDGLSEQDLLGAVVWGLCDRKWSSWTRPLTGYDPESKELTIPSFEGDWWMAERHAPGTKRGGLFYLVGKPALLDAPGEWFYDETTKMIYLKSLDGKSPVHIEAKARKIGVDLAGRKWIRVEGVQLRGCTADLSEAQHCELSRIHATYVSHTRGGNTKMNLGEKSGIFITGSNNVLRDSEIAFSAGNGVNLGGKENAVINCHIHHCNYIGAYTWPLALDGMRNLVSHCTIEYGGRDTVKISGVEHIIQYSDLSNPGQICHDLGIIYTGGNEGGNTQIRYNWLHHAGQEGLDMALYFDNYANNYIAHHNVIWETGTGIRLNRPTGFILCANNTAEGQINNPWGPWEGAKNQWGCAFWNNVTVQAIQMNPEVPQLANLQDHEALTEGFPPKVYNKQGVFLPGITPQKNPNIGAYQQGEPRWRAGHDFETPPKGVTYEPPSSPLRNLIVNSSFDYAPIYAKLKKGKKTPAPWKLIGKTQLDRHPGFNAPPADGRYAVQQYSATMSSKGDGVEQAFTGLLPKKLYHVSGYVRHDDEATNIRFSLLDQKGKEVASADSRKDGEFGGNWWFVKFSFVAGEGQTGGTLRVVNQGPGVAHLDNTGVILNRAPASPQEATLHRESTENYTARMQWFAEAQYGSGPDGKGEVQAQAIDLLKATWKLLEEEPINKNTPEISKVPGIKERD